MSGNIIRFDGATSASAGAARVTQTSPNAGVSNVTPMHRHREAMTSYGAGISAPASRYQRSVTAVAARYERFEDAVLPMVLASGVTGDAAIKVAASIMANDALRAQAEAAHQQARDEAARRSNITLA